MSTTILITGATDGIGLLTATMLAAQGHKMLLHGRSADKLAAAAKQVGGDAETYLADLTRLGDVQQMADAILEKHDTLDVLINNAGVLKAAQTTTPDGYDIRFVVNTFAPYVLTQRLLPIIPKTGRVVNLSSAAQARVDLSAMAGKVRLDDMSAYAQSKLAITIWTREVARTMPDGPVVVAVNPGSLLASKMVEEGFGIAGNDLSIGADILCRAALHEEFAEKSGAYFDNDAGQFAQPNAAASDPDHAAAVMQGVTRAIGTIV
ncbi:SDR family NAD(P)-dependent oxidoreductase [Sulfitobacter sp.]|uniref:SDR family NAD(P)-dependent oxidoreductase n=1 Tax=Sulfitobacter sp. TaxID=1903071 RepID=UPI0030016547